MNWANDSVEFYIDPGNARGAAAMNNSTSAVQLVIDITEHHRPGMQHQVLSDEPGGIGEARRKAS